MENYHILVLDALTKASSQNAELIKIAEEQLQRLETQQGFYSSLMGVVSDQSFDVNIRWLAAVCLKNGVERYWRKSIHNAIAAEEKYLLRQKLLTCFDEPVNQIASQLALIVSKISRFDFPREWSDLFPTLLAIIQLPNDLMQQRGLLVMHHVIKTLATKRLAGDKRIFQQLTPEIFPYILQLWVNHSQTFLQESQNGQTGLKLLLERCFYCLKILKNLVVYGFKEISKEPDAVSLLNCIFQQIKPFLQCRKSLQEYQGLTEICTKYLILLTKVLRDVLELHPFSFVQFLMPSLECVVTLCFTKEYKDVMFERFSVHLLNLVKAILMCQEYKMLKNIEDICNPLTKEANKIKKEFFSVPVVTEIIHQLVSNYFLLTEEDIQNWIENPEQFASDEGGESWKYSIRPCTECLFLAFFREFREIISPLILSIIKDLGNLNSNGFSNVLKKEAVYNVAGLAAFDLFDDVDFDKWFTDVLIPELNVTDNMYYIIRRRVIWLVGQWIGVRLSVELRPLVYEVIISLMRSEENLVVRLTAADTLKLALDDFEFNTEQFVPYLERSFGVLFHLLEDVKECDLKLSILHVLSSVIERVGSQVCPHVNSLMQYLPRLWDNCGEHNMVRCAIICCFIQLVQGLGKLSENLHSYFLPMIALSTNVKLPPHVYLLEDGLDLWMAVIDNTSTCSPELLEIASNILPLLELSSENLMNSLHILNAYILLSPKIFLERYGESVANTFAYIVTDMKPEGVNDVLKVVETAFLLFPVEGPVLFKPVLSIVISLLLENDGLHLWGLSIISRVILHNPNCFGSVIEAKAKEFNQEAEKVLGDILDVWFEKMPCVITPTRRKLMGLALACLLTSGSGTVQYKICGVLLAITEILNDISSVDKGNSSTDSLVTSCDQNYDEDGDSDEEIPSESTRREKEAFRQDPVYSVVLKDYLHSQLLALGQAVGTEKFQDLLSTVDVETMQQLRLYVPV